MVLSFIQHNIDHRWFQYRLITCNQGTTKRIIAPITSKAIEIYTYIASTASKAIGIAPTISKAIKIASTESKAVQTAPITSNAVEIDGTMLKAIKTGSTTSKPTTTYKHIYIYI